jgi:hypothetical protein
MTGRRQALPVRMSSVNVVAELHAAVSSNVVIHDQRGNLTASLFNRFTIDDNPMVAG